MDGSANDLKNIVEGLPCPALRDVLGASSPKVSVFQGEQCSDLVSGIQKTRIQHMNATAMLKRFTCSNGSAVTGLPAHTEVLQDGDDDNYMLPFPLMFDDTAASCMPAPEMDYNCDIRMMNGGLMDGWVTQRDPGFGMSFFNRTDLPFYYALGDHFTIGDQYYQSTFTATCPNREHLFSGSNGLSVPDSGLCLLDDSEPSLTWETMGETLLKGNISWRVYQGQDNFDDNGFAWFENYKNAKPGEALYDLGMARLDDFIGTFADDVANDRLPQVSWIVGPAWLSEHASNHPADGEALSAQLLSVLGKNPDVYKKTAFILNYDEGGQFVDHHWTPLPPKDRSDGLSTVDVTGELTIKEEFNIPAGNPIGLGFRVPLFLVSPWTRGDYVFSQVSDHTSVIQFIEKRFGVHCPNISPWRRAVTSDLTAAFDFENPDYSWPTLPDTSGNANASAWQCNNNPPPVIPAKMSMPAQEPGTKKARSLPYSFEISDAQKGASITITMKNVGSAAAVFFVYDRIAMLSPPRKYTIEGGKTLADTWGFAAVGKYDFRLHGPNGFVRMFAGTALDDAHSISMTYDEESDAVILTSHDANACPKGYAVVDNAYGAAPTTLPSGSALTISVAASGHWYDITATCSSASSSFSRRFMGKMENGKETTTDPAMAKPLLSTFKNRTQRPPRT